MAEEHCKRAGPMGVKTVVYTDIGRDGMLEGTNIDVYRRLVPACSVKIIASGGVSDVSEVKALREVGVEGVIIGKALYTGKIDLREALQAAKG